MRSVEMKFGEWLPDIPSLNNPGVVEALNTYPTIGGFSSFNGPSLTGDTSTEPVLGSEMFTRSDGTTIIGAGSSTRLITRTSAGVTETTGYTALGSDHVWRFERYKDMIVAVTPNNAPQYLADLDVDTSWVALPGSPPKAAVIGRVGDFLMLGDLTDIDGTVAPNRLRWSALNSPTSAWVTDLGELSDYRDLDPKYGAITGITGNLVFQERAIHRITFVGAPRVFDIEAITQDRGCAAPGSLVEIGFNSYFLSQDGFYVTNGGAVDPIGAGKVNKWFLDRASGAHIKKTHGAVNWPKGAIVWAFVKDDPGSYGEQIIFAFDIGRWSHAGQVVHGLVKSKVDATTIGDLAVQYPDGLSGIGVIGNPEWLSSDMVLGAWVASGAGSEYASLTGQAEIAYITMGDRQASPGRRTRVTGIAPVIDDPAEDTRAQAVYRDTLSGMKANTPFTSIGANGFCPCNVDARFVSPRIKTPYGSAWKDASGCQVKVRVSGGR